MKRLLYAAVPLALFAGVASTELQAQSRIQPFFGAGLLAPSGDFSEYAKNGWILFGGFNRAMATNPQMSWGLTAVYGRADHEGTSGEATSLPGLFAELGYALGTGSVFPYLRGSLGFLQHRYDAGDTGYDGESETNFAFGVGAGLAKTLGTNSMFAGVHFTGGDTQFVNVYAGFGMGGSGTSTIRRR